MAFPTLAVIDNFNRSNVGPPLSATWTDLYNGTKVVSNQGVGTTAADSNVSLYEISYGPATECYLTQISIGGTGSSIGVFARCTTLNIATFDGYYVEVVQAATDTWSIYRIDNGTPTLLGATFTQAFEAGDSIGIYVSGSTIQAYYKSGAGAWAQCGTNRTDSTYSAAGYIGLAVTGTDQPFDNFGGGTSGVAPITITLTTASAIAGGIALTVTKGAVSKALSTAALTASGQITDVQPGAISKTLSTAVVTASGPITDVIPGVLSKLLATAALTASGQATSILAGAITRDLATAILTAAGQASDIQPGAISKTLATAALLAEGQIIDVSSGAMITLNTAALTASGQVSDIIVGAIIKTLATAALNAVGQSADVQPGAISTALDTAALTANGQTITVSVPIGSVTITLDTAALISGGQAVDITSGGAIINLDTAALTALGIAISIATMLVAFGNDTYVLFRDKRITVTYRDKRVSVVYQDNRQEAK